MKKSGTKSGKIHQQEWLKLHPYDVPHPSDSYFVTLSNRMLGVVDRMIGDEISSKAKKTIALSVAAYFEDVISGFGLWQGFTRKHFSMYGKYLPFYELADDYIPEEINPEDVSFLIWSIMQLEEKDERVLNPENIGIVSLGTVLFAILDEEYETAPDNETLQDFFTKTVDYDNFIDFRTIVSWFYYDSYLMAPYTAECLDRELDGLKQQKGDKKMKDAVAYTVINELIFKNPCGPLALKTFEWFGAIVGEDTDLGKMLLRTRFKCKMPKTYLITDKDEISLTLLPFDSDEPLFLPHDTFKDKIPYKIGEAILCNLVYFNGRWELNGFMVEIPAEQYEKDREEAETKRDNIKYSIGLFLKATKNKPICYFKNEKDVVAFFNTAFALKEKTKTNHFEGRENFLSFAEHENGIVTIENIAMYVKEKDNPCYDKERAENSGLSLIAVYELSRELIEYLIKNNLIPDLYMNSMQGKEHGRKLVQDNLDFMFRFFQPFSYR